MSTKGLTKAQLIAHLAEHFGLSRTQVSDLLDELYQLSVRELKRSGEFALPGIGKLVLTTRKARTGRNPATGEQIQIPSRTAVKARLSRHLRDLASGSGASEDVEVASAAPGLEGDEDDPDRLA
jgi:DNA-binding protein HU-beta